MKNGLVSGLLLLALFCFFFSSVASLFYQASVATQAVTLAVTGTAKASATPTAGAVTGTSAPTAAPTSAPSASGATTATAAPSATVAPVVYMRYANQDLVGSDVSSSATDPATCAVLCNNNTSCMFYVTDSAGKQCWLKKDPTGFTQNSDRVSFATASAGTPAPSVYAPILNWDSSGNDLNTTPWPLNKSQPDCQQACQDTAGCAYYVVDSSNNRCFLKTSGTPDWKQNGSLTTWSNPSLTLPWTERAGYDNDGPDINPAPLSVANVTGCGQACGANPACKFFVTDTSGTQCWLKSAAGNDFPQSTRNAWLALGQAFAPKTTLYANCNFGGTQVAFAPGEYDTMRSFPNDALSSLRVPPGFAVTLFADTKFGGASKTVTGDVPCLVSQGFNDKTSSFKYYAT